MAVSILWALTAEEQPDFFRAPTLPVCWLLVPFSKFFYLEHLSRFPKGSWDLRKKDPRRSNDMFALLCVYLGQQDGRWEMESQPQPTERVPCFLVKSTKAVLVLYMFASHGPYQVDEWKMCVENLHWEVCWWERCVDGGWESRSLKSYLIFFLLLLLLFSLPLLGFCSPSSSTPSCLCSCSSFHPSSIWLILTQSSSSNVVFSYLPHNPSLGSNSICLLHSTALSTSITHSVV